MQSISQHKLVIIVVALLVLGVAWYGLSGGSGPAPSLTTTGASGASASEKNLVSTLLALRAAKLDATILTDPVFLSLRDFSTQIVPEPVGRTDPFAPLTVSPSNSATSSHNAQIFSPRR